MSNQGIGISRSPLPFVLIDRAVILDTTLSPVDKAVFNVLCAHANYDSHECWLKIATIAQEASCSVRSVHNSLNTLEERGIIQHTPRFSDGRKISSSYKVIGSYAPCYSEATCNDCTPICTSCTSTCTTCRSDMQDVQIYNENHYNDIKDSLTGENAPSVELLTAELPNTPGQESSTTPKEEKPPIKADESQNLDDVPEAMRSTAEFFLLKTGRKSLTEKDLNALCEMNGHQYPIRVQKEISTACERFIRRGQPLTDLTLEYIASSLRNQPTRGRQAKANQAKRKPDPLALTQAEINSAQPAPPKTEAEALARLERAKALLRQKDEEYKAQQEAKRKAMGRAAF